MYCRRCTSPEFPDTRDGCRASLFVSLLLCTGSPFVLSVRREPAPRMNCAAALLRHQTSLTHRRFGLVPQHGRANFRTFTFGPVGLQRLQPEQTGYERSPEFPTYRIGSASGNRTTPGWSW